VDQGEKITAGSAGIWQDDAEDGIDGYCCINGVATLLEYIDACLRGEVMRRYSDAVRAISWSG
jgi:hypothetical protein